MVAEHVSKGELLNRRKNLKVTVGVDSGSAKPGDIVFMGDKLPLEMPRFYFVINQKPSNNQTALYCTEFTDGAPTAGGDSVEIPVGTDICLYYGEVPAKVAKTIKTYIPG